MSCQLDGSGNMSFDFYVHTPRKYQWELVTFKTNDPHQNLFLFHTLRNSLTGISCWCFGSIEIFLKCIYYVCLSSIFFLMNMFFICCSLVTPQDVLWSSAFREMPFKVHVICACSDHVKLLYCLRQEKCICRLSSLLLIFQGLYKSKFISYFFHSGSK